LPCDLSATYILLTTFRNRLKTFLFDADSVTTNSEFVASVIIIIIIIIKLLFWYITVHYCLYNELVGKLITEDCYGNLFYITQLTSHITNGMNTK